MFFFCVGIRRETCFIRTRHECRGISYCRFIGTFFFAVLFCRFVVDGASVLLRRWSEQALACMYDSPSAKMLGYRFFFFIGGTVSQRLLLP